MPSDPIQEALREDDDGTPEPATERPRLSLPSMAELIVGALGEAGYTRGDVSRFAREYMQGAPGDMPVAAFHWILEVERRMPADGAMAVWNAERVAEVTAVEACRHLNSVVRRGSGRQVIDETKIAGFARALAHKIAAEVDRE